MSEEKTKIRVIKKASSSPAPAPAPAPKPAAASAQQPEKKVVVIKKKIVQVKAKVKEDRPAEPEKPAAPAPSAPAQENTAAAPSQPVSRPAAQPASKPRPLVQPAASRLASTVPAANRNLVGGERGMQTFLLFRDRWFQVPLPPTGPELSELSAEGRPITVRDRAAITETEVRARATGRTGVSTVRARDRTVHAGHSTVRAVSAVPVRPAHSVLPHSAVPAPVPWEVRARPLWT